MMYNIKTKKKFSRGISYFRYIFGNNWDSKQATYLILTETLTPNPNFNYKFV